MATWYVDYEGGTDSNASAGNGDSFATRRKRIDNLVAAALSPGDTVRIMASPSPTSMGQNAQWTDGPLRNFINIQGSTNTSPIVITVNSSDFTANNFKVGDTVIVDSHSVNTNANGVWTISATNGFNTITLVNADGSNSIGNGVGSVSGRLRKFTNAVVTLASAVTKNIALCGYLGTKPNWTASANVTNTNITTDWKEGYSCQQIAIAAGFTTGLAAYYATGTLDLSSYQQVSFWVKQTAGTIGAAGAVRLRLCTDTAGATPVHDIPIPALGALSQWVPVVVDLGTNLNSAIQSVSFDVVTDNGAQTFLIDHIIACKASSAADSLNLTSLISKDPGDHSYGDGYECWWAIQSINGTRIVLEGTVNSIPGSSPQRGYSGTTESVNLYKRETVKTVAVASSATATQTVSDSGTSAARVSFSGGWDRTGMSTQVGDTWYDGVNGYGAAISDGGAGIVWISFDRLGFVRYNWGIAPGTTAHDWQLGRIEACSTTGSPINYGAQRLSATTLSAVSCGGPITPGTAAVVQTIGRADSTTSGNGVTLGAGSWTGTIKSASNNAANGVSSGISGYINRIEKASYNASNAGYAPASMSVAGYVSAIGNATNGITATNSYFWKILSGNTSGNGGQGVSFAYGLGFIKDFTISDATKVNISTVYADGRVYSENHDNTAGYAKIFCDGGLIETQTSVVHGSATRAWKFSPTSTNRSQYYPLNLAIAQIAVAANSLVTVKCWFRRSNTGLTGRLMCKGGQLSGVASDVYSDMTAIADTWQELSISFTPTESGVIEIEAQFWGGTTYNGYISDATITQS